MKPAESAIGCQNLKFEREKVGEWERRREGNWERGRIGEGENWRMGKGDTQGNTVKKTSLSTVNCQL